MPRRNEILPGSCGVWAVCFVAVTSMVIAEERCVCVCVWKERERTRERERKRGRF